VDTTGRNPWVVLGLPEGASYDMARRAFRRKAALTHPDHGGDHRSFLAVQAAWDALRPLLPVRPATPDNPYRRLIAPTPGRPDLLEGPRQRPRPGPAGGSTTVVTTFASLLERELGRLAAA
jgi:curved DNA-binding protein CbpA